MNSSWALAPNNLRCAGITVLIQRRKLPGGKHKVLSAEGSSSFQLLCRSNSYHAKGRAVAGSTSAKLFKHPV